MSKIALSAAGIVLVAVGIGIGYGVGLASDPGPPPPRTAEERARAIELYGELRGILMEPNFIVRARDLAEALTGLGPEDARDVATLLQSGAIGLGAPEAALLTRFWAMHDPEEAATWALSRAVPIGVRPTVSEAALEAWAASDPERAREVMEQIVSRLNGPAADTAQAAFVRGWVASGRPGVIDYIHEMAPDIPQRRNLTTLVQEKLLREGVDETIALLESLPDEDAKFKLAAFRSAAPEIFKADRDAALAWCDRNCEKPHGDNVRALIAKQWATEDGRAAMAWVASAPAGRGRDQATWQAFSAWRRADPDDLLAWLDEMGGPDHVEPWFYAAVDRVAMWKSWEEPLEAYRWAALIPDEERRELAMISITRRYREADEAGAEAWLEQSPLSPEAREKARTFPERWRGRGSAGSDDSDDSDDEAEAEADEVGDV